MRARPVVISNSGIDYRILARERTPVSPGLRLRSLRLMHNLLAFARFAAPAWIHHPLVIALWIARPLASLEPFAMLFSPRWGYRTRSPRSGTQPLL